MLQKQATSEHIKQPTVSQPLETAYSMPRLFQMLWVKLLDRRSILSYLPIVLAITLLFCGASWQMFHLHTDPGHYQCYALTFWQGNKGTNLLPDVQCSYLYQLGMPPGNVPAFRIVPFEYPPLTLLIFSPALLAPLADYQVAFAITMALVAILIYWLLQRFGPRGAGLVCAFYLVIGAWATAEGRFDLVPASLTLLSLIAAERKRWTLAYIALALSVLLKIYPLLLLPGLFMAEQIDANRFYRPVASLTFRTLPREIWLTLRGARDWRWKNTLLLVSLIVMISGLFALLNFQGAFVSQVSYFTARPVQIESTGSTLLWLATLFGHPATVQYTFGSFNVISNLDDLVASLFEILFVIGYCMTILWQWRGKLNLGQTFLALLLVFIVTGKVFSPQYLIWLIPLLAYNQAFSRLWLILWSIVFILTTIVYPYYYSYVPDIRQLPNTPGFVEIVALRNLLLLLITLAFLFNWWNLNRSRKTVPQSSNKFILPERSI